MQGKNQKASLVHSYIHLAETFALIQKSFSRSLFG